MIANIDGDLITYPCAASCEPRLTTSELASMTPEQIKYALTPEPLEVALLRCDKLIREILEASDCEEYNLFLSTKSNFRKEINSEYKANRKDTIPPQWLQQCKEYLLTEWNAKVKEYYEADDLLGISQSNDTVLCSFDKDLLMIPGRHFNWKKQQYGDITIIEPYQGLQYFYAQMLIGDKTDNVIGIQGIGPVKANKALDQCEDEQEMFDYVYDKYNDPERFLINAQCLWIMQKEGETWAHRTNGLIFDECMMGLVNDAKIKITSLLNTMENVE